MERLRKLGLSGTSVADGSIAPPVVPPRQRHNPFNTAEREDHLNSSARRVSKKKTFSDIHAEYGREIVKARELWLKSQMSNIGSLTQITEDVLVTL